MRTTRYATTGLALGVTWGVLARIWMRLISTQPHFSWTGTVLLIGAAGVVGALLGLVQAARVRGGSRWWRLVYLLVLAFLAEGGPPLLAAVALAGWAVRRGRWGRLVATVVVLLTAAGLTVIFWNEPDLGTTPFPDALYRAIAAVGGLLVIGTAAWASSVVLAPWDRRRSPAIPQGFGAVPVSAG